MSSGIGVLVDLTIVTLLIVTIAFAAVLNRRLAAWRQDRGEFERLIAQFNQAAARAEAGVERLKAASEQTGKTLQQAVTKGQSLRDDLAYLIERGEPLADRLTEGVRSARMARREEIPPPPPAASVSPQKTEAAGTRPANDDERARMKRDLLRVLSALR
jgi:septal ring factor EnvC (AmiA/AmiB activator)